MSIVPQKQCTNCLNCFPPTTEYFHTRKATKKDGLSPMCKTCANAGRQKRAKDHPEVREAYEARNADRIKRVSKEYIANRPDVQEKVRVRAKKWYWGNIDYARQRGREYGRMHSKEAVERSKKWAKDNPERYKAIMANRYALEKNAEGEYTAEDLSRIYDELEGRCAYCGISLYWHIKRDVHVDHIVPLSKGGSNWPDNITLACCDCNSSKSDKLLADWLLVRGW